MNEHTSLEKYTSHILFSKGLRVRDELEMEQTATYWPQVPLTIAALLSHSAGLLKRGSWGPKPSAGSWFSLPRTATRTPTNWLQLTQTIFGTGLYNCLTPTCFRWHRNCTEFNLSTVKVIPWYLWPDAPAIYTGVSLNWQLGRGSICFTADMFNLTFSIQREYKLKFYWELILLYINDNQSCDKKAIKIKR